MKKTNRTNYRVMVHPRNKEYGIEVASEEDVCEEIVSDINRHVNKVLFAEIICDIEYVCGCCGSRWTEDSESYNGGCCDQDQERYEEKEGE